MDQGDVVPPIAEPDNISSDSGKKMLELVGSVSETQPWKKSRLGGGSTGDDDMRRVAEIVIVLSALGNMRGGQSPTSAERGLMLEAREKLARMCEPVAPKDLLPSDVVKAVVDDLGFNNARDARLGFHPPKMSIAEKVSSAKRKIVESKELNAQTALRPPQQLQVGISKEPERISNSSNEVAVHGLSSEKPSSVPLSTGGFQPGSSVVFVSALPAPSSMNQSQVSMMQPAFVLMPSFGSSVENAPSSLPLSQVDGGHFRLDAQPAYLFQVQAGSVNHISEASVAPCSTQSMPTAGNSAGEAVKLSNHDPAVSEVAHERNAFQPTLQTSRRVDCKPTSLASSGNVHTIQQPFQPANVVHAPARYNNHNDIARNVQKILQSRLPERSNWTNPSVNYISETLPCQVCKVSIADVENLLVCDACEQGVHLKCLQSYHAKGIPKGDWHCPNCVTTSNGKPLPPKYGRVTRNVHAPKASPNTSGIPRKMENTVQKGNHLKSLAIGKPDSLRSTQRLGPISSSSIESLPGQKLPSARECVDSSFSETVKGDPLSRNCSDGPSEKMVEACKSSTCSETGENILNRGAASDQIERKSSALNPQDGVHYPHAYHNQSSEAIIGNLDLKKPSDECKMGFDDKMKDQAVAQLIYKAPLDDKNGSRRSDLPSLDVMHSVDWVGGAVEVVDDKIYYESCCINGAGYRLQDYALFSNSKKLLPAKLEFLWEEKKSGVKWATVNLCYFPCDLPEAVGRPCRPEYNEVYDSNHQTTIMLGLIHGPCDVLTPEKYREENERRTHTGHGANYGFHPIFQCRWFYDHSRGLFRPVVN